MPEVPSCFAASTTLVVAGPLPDADPFGEMHNCGGHGQPLGQRVLFGNHYIHIVPAAQAVIKDGQRAVGVRRQIDPHDVGPGF